jgi:hypothetical protein
MYNGPINPSIVTLSRDNTKDFKSFPYYCLLPHQLSYHTPHFSEAEYYLFTGQFMPLSCIVKCSFHNGEAYKIVKMHFSFLSYLQLFYRHY